MHIGSAWQTGISGMQTSQQNMNRAAMDVVSSGTEGGRTAGAVPAEPLVDLMVQEKLFTASAKVVSTADEALGTLLDVTA